MPIADVANVVRGSEPEIAARIDERIAAAHAGTTHGGAEVTAREADRIQAQARTELEQAYKQLRPDQPIPRKRLNERAWFLTHEGFARANTVRLATPVSIKADVDALLVAMRGGAKALSDQDNRRALDRLQAAVDHATSRGQEPQARALRVLVERLRQQLNAYSPRLFAKTEQSPVWGAWHTKLEATAAKLDELLD